MYYPIDDHPSHPRTVYRLQTDEAARSYRIDGGTAVADVAIIGGGLIGLSAALHARALSSSVVVLEANEIAWGAIGRSAGQVSAHATKFEPTEVLRIYGARVGERLNDAGAHGPERLKEFAAQYGIDLHAVDGGILNAAHTAQAFERYRSRAEYWQRQGAPVELLDRSRVTELLGSPSYIGGVVDRRGFAINPLSLALGLARAAAERGVAIGEHARVTRISREGRTWLLSYEGGSLRAENVLICTNAYTGNLWPVLHRTVIPVRSYQIFTKPLSCQRRRKSRPLGGAKLGHLAPPAGNVGRA